MLHQLYPINLEMHYQISNRIFCLLYRLDERLESNNCGLKHSQSNDTTKFLTVCFLTIGVVTIMDLLDLDLCF